MCEAAMAQISNHNLILNEECSSQDNQQHLISRYNAIESAQISNENNNNSSNNNRAEVEEDDEVVDEDDEEVVDDEEQYQAARSNNSAPGSSTSPAGATDTSSQDVSGLRQNIIYLQHQITLLMNALHVPTCKCDVCKPICQSQANIFSKLKDSCVNLATSQGNKIENIKTATEMKNNLQTINDIKNHNVLNKSFAAIPPETAAAAAAVAAAVQANSAAVGCAPFGTATPNVKECEAWLQHVFSQTGMGTLAQTNLSGLAGALGLNFAAQKPFNNIQSSNNYSAPNPGGRKSKYCSPAEKKAVADYANIHGASAAARKFNIPPPVAAYYHRKEYKKPALQQQIQQPTMHIESPGTTSGDDVESSNGDWAHNGQISSGTSQNHGTTNNSHLNGVTDILKMEQQKANPAHSTGSPGFLRGRGRGRPKLIGDELDAELVDYMVQLKQSDPRGHLTASQALSIARDYIMEKAPGLLEEHGGQIKLKLTWAMKLVTRISERQKEIELGLPPAGSGGIAMPGGNFMADMMAQNLLSQQMSQIMGQTMTGTASATPEILNVRELELPKHSESDGNKGEVISDMDFKQNNSFKSGSHNHFDEEMETQNNDGSTEAENRNHSNDQLQQHYIPTNAF